MSGRSSGGHDVEKYLFTIESVWTITGRGLILGPGVGADEAMRIPRGAKIELRRPDGTDLVTEIDAIEYPPSLRWLEVPENPRYGVIVRGEIKKSDVPIGTEVYLSGPQ